MSSPAAWASGGCGSPSSRSPSLPTVHWPWRPSNGSASPTAHTFVLPVFPAENNSAWPLPGCWCRTPAIVIADEPVSSLDPARANEITRLLVGITKESGKTLIASIHAVELAREHFSRVIGLRNGAIQFDIAGQDVTDETLRSLYDLRGLRGEA